MMADMQALCVHSQYLQMGFHIADSKSIQQQGSEVATAVMHLAVQL